MTRWRRSAAAQAWLEPWFARWELASYSARLAEAFLADRWKKVPR